PQRQDTAVHLRVDSMTVRAGISAPDTDHATPEQLRLAARELGIEEAATGSESCSWPTARRRPPDEDPAADPLLRARVRGPAAPLVGAGAAIHRLREPGHRRRPGAAPPGRTPHARPAPHPPRRRHRAPRTRGR